MLQLGRFINVKVSVARLIESQCKGLKSMDSSHSLSALDTCLEKELNKYFKELDKEKVGNVYDMVLGLVEKKLINIVLDYCNNNYSKTAKLLGINRNTLRKKMQQHNLLFKK